MELFASRQQDIYREFNVKQHSKKDNIVKMRDFVRFCDMANLRPVKYKSTGDVVNRHYSCFEHVKMHGLFALWSI